MNPLNVIKEAVIDVGCVGLGGVGNDTFIAVEEVAPLEFVASTITLYVIGPYKLVNVAVLLATETTCGITVEPFNVNV